MEKIQSHSHEIDNFTIKIEYKNKKYQSIQELNYTLFVKYPKFLHNILHFLHSDFQYRLIIFIYLQSTLKMSFDQDQYERKGQNTQKISLQECQNANCQWLTSIFQNRYHWEEINYSQSQKKKKINDANDEINCQNCIGLSYTQQSVSQVYAFFDKIQSKQQFQPQISIISDEIKTIEQKLKLNQKFQHIFTFQLSDIKKNSNVQKYFMKKFLEFHSPKLKNLFDEDFDEDVYKEINRLVDFQKQQYAQNENWNNNLDSIYKLFGVNSDSVHPTKRSYMMRKIAHKLIKKKIIPSVLDNKQISKKMIKTYIFTLKAQMLRCKNPQLMKRTQLI